MLGYMRRFTLAALKVTYVNEFSHEQNSLRTSGSLSCIIHLA